MRMHLIRRYVNRRTFSSLGIRNYRLYFIGQAVSLTGTWMQTVALAWLVLELSHSGTALGQIWGLQFLPILLFGPMAGVLVDRFRKKKVLYITQIASAILALSLGVLVYSGSIRLWMVYVISLAMGFVTAVDNPTRQTFVQDLVGKEHISNAVTLNTAELYLTRVIGPTVAAVIIATAGIAACFILNAVSFVAVIVVLRRMRDRDIRPAPAVVARMRGQLVEGIRYVLATPTLLNALLMMSIVGTLTYEFAVNLPLLAQGTFRGDAATYAALTAAMGIGSVIGGLLIASRTQATNSMLISSSAFFGLTVIAAAMMPTELLMMGMLAAVGYFSINFMSLSNIILQLESKPAMRGRVMSLWTVAFMGSTVIGGPLIGWIGENIGPRWSLGTSGMAAVFAAGVGYWTLGKLPRKVIPSGVALTAEVAVAAEDKENAQAL